MPQRIATVERAYQCLKAALLDGSLARHDRFELAAQARAFDMSVTPLREAAMRLLGEGLIEFATGGGLRAVPLTERRVRELLTLNHRLCLTSLTLVDARHPARIRLKLDERTDVEAAARGLFEAVAKSTGNSVLAGLVAQVNDGLSPIRRCEVLVLPHARSDVTELAALMDETGRARTHALGRYHRVRLNRAASLVWAARRDPDA